MIARLHPLRLAADATGAIDNYVGGRLAGAAAHVVVLLYQSIDGLRQGKPSEPKPPGTSATDATTCTPSNTYK